MVSLVAKQPTVRTVTNSWRRLFSDCCKVSANSWKVGSGGDGDRTWMRGTERISRSMCLVRWWLCSAEDVVLRTEKAPGNCPFCSGAVTATDIESSWRLCCLPLCRKIKRNFSCSECSRRLVVSSSLY
ncbi:hypothetical protein ZIOFF_069152 [Zingiber officinale]|uniref:Uncharacterized protein n=1 Tax=Zingiber officinale TaxID=94328 RepID=A0A8J5BGH5_ZINOF|nr:hypothetical protein ZIOFF_069152 [Zingiber officinale]